MKVSEVYDLYLPLSPSSHEDYRFLGLSEFVLGATTSNGRVKIEYKFFEI